MKKRHVTELTGQELNAAFRAAALEAQQTAAKLGLDVSGRTEFGVDALTITLKPDGSILSQPDAAQVSASGKKRTAA
jgi:hypothetical protein